MHRSAVGEATVVGLLAVAIVTILSLLTNRMAPQWDMIYYVDMAEHGLLGNPNLWAPFAYRPGTPLLVNLAARFSGADVVSTFRAASHVACVVVIVACYAFTRSQRIPPVAAGLATLAICLDDDLLKWAIFSGIMLDIFAYPIFLLAFWLLLEGYDDACLLVSGVGLFFKEFLLLPILVLTALRALQAWPRGAAAVAWPLAKAGVVLALTFVLPRLLIPVSGTSQDIDPLNAPDTIKRLISYPLSFSRDFNILFAYGAFWLPTLLLLTQERALLVWDRWRDRLPVLGLYFTFHFLLVMYGGTNLTIFVTYLLPAQLLALGTILAEARVPRWEVVAMFAIVVAFNRPYAHIPVPTGDEKAVGKFLDFFGGYHMRISLGSVARFVLLESFILGFIALRAAVSLSTAAKREESTAASTA